MPKAAPHQDRTLWSSLAAFFAVLLIGALPLAQYEYTRIQNQREVARDLAAERAFQLRERLDDALSATRALTAIIRQGKGYIGNFDALATEMLPLYPGAQALGLAPAGIVSTMIPLAGNEKAIGHDLFKDPKRATEARISRDTRQMVLAGPFPLRQGGVAAIGRNPVFLNQPDGTDTFWGFTFVIIELKALLDVAQLPSLEKAGYHYELWRNHPDSGKPDIFARSAGAAPLDPEHHEILVPNGRWTLSIAPANGWYDGNSLKAGGGLLLAVALAIAFATRIRLQNRAQLRAEQSARQESDARLHSLVANLPGAAYRCALDADWTIKYVSDGIVDIAGHAAGEFTSHRRSYASIIHPDDVAAVDRMVRSALAQRQPYALEYRIFHADGSIRWVFEKGHGIFDTGDHLIYLEGVLLDVTEHHRADEALHELNETLEQRIAERTAELSALKDAAESANRAKSAFLANMSHELRTPLNAILGFAQLMVRERRIPADQQKYLDTISRSGQHLLALINDVLEISRIEAGRDTLNVQSVDLHEMLDELVEMSALRARDKGLLLLLERDPAVPRHVDIDAGKLRQVLINLLSNAVKFTTHGEIVLTVDCPPAADMDAPSQLRFAVRDTGSGMTPEETGHLFQAFYQTQTGTTQHEGTGLGLAISHQFVQMMGGELKVASTPGRGSTFSFCIPFSATTEPLPTTSESGASDHAGGVHTRASALAPHQGEVRALVVDDNSDHRLLTSRLLQQAGFVTREAPNGIEGLAQFKLWQPQLVIMDMRMPGMDGAETARQMRHLEGGRETVIVMLTASAFAEERATMLAVGADEVIVKPFDIGILLGLLSQRPGFAMIAEATGSKVGTPRVLLAGRAGGTAASALQGLSAATRDRLRAAAVELDSALVRTIVQDLAAEQPALAETLRDLADAYRFDDIVRLLENPS